ncbi:MAG: hypothetical protein RSB42_18300, partial [Comamonas sp.]
RSMAGCFFAAPVHPALVWHASGPACNVLERIERSLVVGELREVKAGALDGLHVFFLDSMYCLLIDKE